MVIVLLMVAALAINLSLGTLSVVYLLSFTSIDLPMILDILAGLFLGEATIPVAMVVAILDWINIF